MALLMKKYSEEHIYDYTHFVVWIEVGCDDGLKIESGWHYKEDAQDQLNEIQEVLDYAEKNDDGALRLDISVASRKQLLTAWNEKDITNDDNWAGIPW